METNPQQDGDSDACCLALGLATDRLVSIETSMPEKVNADDESKGARLDNEEAVAREMVNNTLALDEPAFENVGTKDSAWNFGGDQGIVRHVKILDRGPLSEVYKVRPNWE